MEVFLPAQEDAGPPEADFIKSSRGPCPIHGTALRLCPKTKDFCLLQWGGDWCLFHDCSGFTQRVYSAWVAGGSRRGRVKNCHCSMFLLELRNHDRKQQGLQKTQDRRKWLSCEVNSFRREPRNLPALVYSSFFKVRLYSVTYPAFCKKQSSIIQWGDKTTIFLTQFSDPTQPEKYHLSIFSSSWWESRCGIMLMLSESQCIVQLLDLDLFLKNVLLRHSEL